MKKQKNNLTGFFKFLEMSYFFNYGFPDWYEDLEIRFLS